MSNAMMDAIFAGLTSQRPEFKDAMTTWSEKLEPALHEREAERKAIIAKARSRTIWTSGIIAVAALILITWRVARRPGGLAGPDAARTLD